MRDHLHELADGNPIDAERLRPAVAVDHRVLLDTIRAEGSPSDRRLSVVPDRPTVTTGRVAFIGAGLAAAAAFAAIALAGMRNVPEGDPTTAEPADRRVEQVEETPVVEVPEVGAAEVEVVDVPEAGSDEADVSPTVSVEDTGAADPSTEGRVQADEPAGAPPTTDPSPTDPNAGTGSTTADTAPTDARPTDARPAPTADGPFDPTLDLLSIHYDHAPGMDDGQSAVAAREITSRLGIEPHVVSGAYGTNGAQYNAGSEPVMRQAWGDGWLNAHRDRPGAVRATADRWLATIDGGGRIWVAEGGQSDVTAGVIRELMQRRPGLDTRRVVHVIQHNDFNEDASTDADLNLVRSETTYVRIADGNIADNGTADLDMRTPGFADIALNGRYASAWQAAFDYHEQDGRIDFSDTVAILHIIGVGTDDVADPLTFAEYFIR